jgi:hypothetical protein
VSAKDPTGDDIFFDRRADTGNDNSCDQEWGETHHSVKSCYGAWATAFRDLTPGQEQAITSCISKYRGSAGMPVDLLQKYKDAFKPVSPSGHYCVFCQGSGGSYGLPADCKWMEDSCETYWGGADEQWGISCPPVHVPFTEPFADDKKREACRKALKQMKCDGGTIICSQATHPGQVGSSQACCNYVPIHELTHAISDFSHQTTVSQHDHPDWLTALTRCVCEAVFGAGKCDC